MNDTSSPEQTISSPDSGAEPGARAGPARVLGRAAAVVAGAAESVLFLAPLAFIFDLAGYLSPDIRLFGIYALLGIPLCRLRGAGAREGLLVWIAAIAVNGIFSLPAAAEIPILAGAHLRIWSLAGVAYGPVVRGLVFYTLLHLYLFVSPLGYQVLEALAAAVREFSHWVTGTTLNVGYTYANIGSLLLFLCLSLHGWERGVVSKFRTGAYLVVAVMINAFAAVLFVEKMNVAPELTWELKFRDYFTLRELTGHLADLALLWYPAFLFVVHAAVYLFLHHDSRTPGEDAPADTPAAEPAPVSRTGQRLFVAAAVVLVLAAIPPAILRRPSPSKLIFINGSGVDDAPGGRRGVVSFTKPDWTRFGRAAGGMYGMFPEYASLFGCQGEVVDELPETLNPDEILVITNLDEPTLPEEMERIWSFVRAGGKLWVLGDHTFIKNGRNHINDLLEPCNITFNHDSAQFWPQGWFHCYRMRDGTPFAALEDPAENRLSLLVGASLDLAPPARPFVMGRFGYGDWGVMDDADDRGYLGDFEYQPTERCGDLVLVAGEKVGKGKVLAFGDTTSFFNANLTRSYEILRASLSWLGEPSAFSFFSSRGLGLAVLAAGIGLLLWSMARGVAAPGLLLIVAVVSFAVHRPGLLPIDRDVGRSRVGVFDFSHQPYAAKHGSLGEGIYGLSLSFLRYGMLPITQNGWDGDVLDKARILVLNAPRRPFSMARRRQVMAFMERGGTVLLACGAPHYKASEPLLEPLGLSVRNLPLGRFFDRPAFNQPVQYFSAWPIDVRNPDARLLSMYRDWPLMVDVPVGEGRLVLVADSEFFHNKNLESHEQYSAQNTQFVRNLFDYVNTKPPAAEPETGAHSP